MHSNNYFIVVQYIIHCRDSLTKLVELGFLEVFTLEYSLYLAEKSWANMGEVGVEALECLKLPCMERID